MKCAEARYGAHECYGGEQKGEWKETLEYQTGASRYGIAFINVEVDGMSRDIGIAHLKNCDSDFAALSTRGAAVAAASANRLLSFCEYI